MTHGSEWDMEIWRPEVANVTRGHIPRTTVCHMFCRMMAAFLRVLPTRWRRGRIACKMAAMQNKQNVNKNNVEYVLRLQCRIYLVNVTWPSDTELSDGRYGRPWRGEHSIMLNVWRNFDQSAKQFVVGHATNIIFLLRLFCVPLACCAQGQLPPHNTILSRWLLLWTKDRMLLTLTETTCLHILPSQTIAQRTAIKYCLL